jgi:hypothetical protein
MKVPTRPEAGIGENVFSISELAEKKTMKKIIFAAILMFLSLLWVAIVRARMARSA